MDEELSPYKLLMAERSRDRAELVLELRGLTPSERAAWWREPNQWLTGTGTPEEALFDDPDAVVNAAEQTGRPPEHHQL